MNNIEKIRQEIERQLEYFKGKEDDAWDDCDNYTDEDAQWYQGHWKMCSKLLSFINSLPEEKPSENLEKAARLYAIPHYMKDIDVNYIEEYPYNTGLEAAFIAGSEWMAKQGVTFTAAVDHYEDFYLDSCDQEAEAIKKLGLKVMDWAIVQIRKK